MIDRLTLVATVVLLGSTLAPAASERQGQAGSRTVPEVVEERSTAPAPFRLLRATYAIDVLGPLAVGELAREFASDNDTELEAASIAAVPGLAVERVEVEVAGRVRELQAPASGRRESAASRKNRPPAKSTDRPARQEPILVEAGQSLTRRDSFRMTLPIREGRFLLRLPAVAEAGVVDPSSGGPLGGITVIIHHDEPLLHAESPSHDVIVAYEGDRTVVELAEGESESREFEFEFAFGLEDDPTLVGQAVPTDDGAHDVVLVLTPPTEPGENTVRPKQVLFVLDASGSMAKGKLDQAREALGTCLAMLRAGDQFNIIAFKNSAAAMSEGPLNGEEASIQRAVAWLGRLRSGGGTHLLPALGTAFEQPVADEHHRMVVLLTDGAIQDRSEAERLLEQDLGQARLFVMGIGEDVSRASIARLAEFGRGTAVFADDPEGLDSVMAAMFASVSEPLAWDLDLDWGGAEVLSIEPTRLPDLYAGRPVTVRARVRGELPGEVALEATTTGGLRRFATTLTTVGDGNRARLGRH